MLWVDLVDWYDYDVTQELLNGVLWVLGAHMVMAKALYLLVTYADHYSKPPQRYVVVMRGSWYARQDVQLTIAWMVFLIGFVALRWWVWHLRECVNDLGEKACAGIEQNHVLLYVAAAFCIAGGVCSIRIMLPGRWQPWAWLYVLAASMAIPLVYRVWL